MEAIATREACGLTLAKLGRVNKNIIVLDADLSESTKSIIFAREFPERFFNYGVAEQNMTASAVGIASCGKVVFINTFAIFATGRTWDQIRNGVTAGGFNVKIVGSHGGLSVGPDGLSHQCIEDVSLMRAIPEMVVIVPSDRIETEKVIEKAAEYYGPVYIRTSRAKSPNVNNEDYKFEIGKGNILQDGSDVTIIACGVMVEPALNAAKALIEKKIHARVINMACIKPIDKDMIIRAAKETGAIVTVEDHTVIGGLGSAVAEVLGEEYPVPLKRIGVLDRFGESGEPNELFKKNGMTAENIAEEAKKIILRKNR
ncbi:MAG: transketolase family protein [bacterium]|nr:transketolase family protein [bacterium]